MTANPYDKRLLRRRLNELHNEMRTHGDVEVSEHGMKVREEIEKIERILNAR